ncbi:MAG: DUF547 domain-containing protein [Chlorobi bacterium]|nr:DUF547 domain-containing protein [Chlorobiota bacterium]
MKKPKTITLLVALLFGIGFSANANPGTGHVDHTAWNTLLQKYVSADGVVNYREMKKEEDVLNTYIGKLGKNTPEKTWGENEKLTYWINLYNASTVSLILKNYPLKSIREIEKPWDIVFVKAGDKEYSLNDIEHEIIRKEFDEPRIHFALVCAAKSCPPLLNEAYDADKLDAQLHQQGVKFINNPKKNEIAVDNIKISKLFDWYKGDFTKEGSLIGFLNGFAKTKISADAKIGFMDYDWSLNE